MKLKQMLKLFSNHLLRLFNNHLLKSFNLHLPKTIFLISMVKWISLGTLHLTQLLLNNNTVIRIKETIYTQTAIKTFKDMQKDQTVNKHTETTQP